jgi:hypothetical protein
MLKEKIKEWRNQILFVDGVQDELLNLLVVLVVSCPLLLPPAFLFFLILTLVLHVLVTLRAAFDIIRRPRRGGGLDLSVASRLRLPFAVGVLEVEAGSVLRVLI